MKTAILFVLCCALAAQAVPAVESLTVISVTGDVNYRVGGGAWQPLRGGERIPAEAVARTGENSTLGLITAEGRVVRIAAGREQPVLAPGAAEESTAARVLAIFKELFGDARRTRMAASRGAQDESAPATQAQLARFYQKEWDELLALPRLGSTELPRAMETAAFYQERATQNRAVALLGMLARDLPGEPGVAALARAARGSFGEPASLVLVRHAGSARQPLAPQDVIHSGEGLQVRYQSDTESYLYLYLYSVPAQGAPALARLQPPAGERANPIPAETAFFLPKAGDTYVMDQAVGREYLWAWSCGAPLNENRAEKPAAERLRQRIRAGDLPPASLGSADLPAECPQGFFTALEHR